MLPTAISLWNYRAFSTPVTLEFRPITLLYGINNAGKSALLRALPIISESIGPDASGPLHLESPAAFESTFLDLRWKGIRGDEDPDLGLSIHWEASEGSRHLTFALTWFTEWRRMIIRRFSLHPSQGSALIEAEWVPRPQERQDLDLTYEWRGQDGPPSQGRFGFQGLLPATMPEPCRGVLGDVAKALLGLRHQVQWLGASRRGPRRLNTYPGLPRWRLRYDGSDVAHVLASHPEVLSEVSDWYERNFERALAIQDRAPSEFRLVLRNMKMAELDVDLIDTGEGMIQVLSILTALALGRRSAKGGPGIVAIEEPESHLHPRLQRALAEEICAVTQRDSASSIVLETHSEHILLGVQREIVRGRIRPEDVVVHWIRQLDTGESLAELITFDQDARPQGNWPPGVFSDDTDVAREIIQARRDRSGS